MPSWHLVTDARIAAVRLEGDAFHRERKGTITGTFAQCTDAASCPVLADGPYIPEPLGSPPPA
jgi:hypothetical protein